MRTFRYARYLVLGAWSFSGCWRLEFGAFSPPHSNTKNTTKGHMNNHIKLNATAVNTRSEMETLVREIAGLKLNERLLTTGMDAEIQAVRSSYEGRLATLTQVL